ncbi:MAG: PRD domain-containing protein [Anaerorhabdus sp.]
MKLLKKINNNFAIAEDSKGEKIIVEGKGVGFMKMPCELDDIGLVSRTYYNYNSDAIRMIQGVSPDILAVANKISDYAKRTISTELNFNLAFTLADHIEFCIERARKKIYLKNPFSYDVEHLYPSEIRVAEYALMTIEEDLDIKLDSIEKIGIALNIINSEMKNNDDNEIDETLIRGCITVIEQDFDIEINRESFNYSRFATHMKYLLQRTRDGEIEAASYELYKAIRKQYPKAYEVVNKISKYLKENQFLLREEDKLYLMLHVQRLCDREDCYREGITQSQ